MGVYINREMPESCFVCFVKDCAARAKNKYVMSSRGQKCPIYLVPPHGRLIDADALRQSMYHEAFETDSPMQKWDSGCWIRYKMFERLEENAPTIIPAEEGEA